MSKPNTRAFWNRMRYEDEIRAYNQKMHDKFIEEAIYRAISAAGPITVMSYMGPEQYKFFVPGIVHKGIINLGRPIMMTET